MVDDRADEPRTEHQSVRPVDAEGGTFELRVVRGPDSGGAKTIAATDPEMLVGQSVVCGLRITDPKVSRRHASVEVSGGRLRVRDLSSTNGTWIGSIAVGEVFLGGGEQFAIGDSVVEVRRLVDHPTRSTTETFGSLVTTSRAMQRLVPLMRRIAASNVPVLIEGETGTGKEVVARSIHSESPRANAPFIVFDCSAVSPSVIESELFGHERGAFTGAVAQRKGVFEQAHGGTLFIDELGELPLDLQARLLRAIERSEVRRVGGSDWIRCDVRVVAATRRDIDAYVLEGRFRDDLFHRLAVGRLALPPLRQRPEDIAELVARFAREVDPDAAPIPSRTIDEWRRSAWPGNVRELRNAVFRHLALGAPLDDDEEPEVISSGHEDVEGVLGLRLPFPKARARMIHVFERRYVEYMVQLAGGSVQQAAQLSGVALRYFQLLRARHRRP